MPSRLTLFEVIGPQKIPLFRNRGGASICAEGIKEFWARNTSLKKRRGCYLFCNVMGKGISPWYVGRATKNFHQEIFTPDKLNKYCTALSFLKRKSPHMLFIVYPSGVGAPNRNLISQLETFLIQCARVQNPNLVNKQKVKIPKWGIKGVIRGKRGKPPTPAQKLKIALSL